VVWKELGYGKTETLADVGRRGGTRRDGGGIICYDKEIVEVLPRRTMWRGCTDKELC